MNNLKYYIIPLRYKKINQKLGTNLLRDKKINIFEDKNDFNEKKIKDFYKKYEKELNSFKMKDLMKIFEETGICIYRVLHYQMKNNNYNNPKYDIGKFIVKPTSIYYWNNENYSDIRLNYVRKKYRDQEIKLNQIQSQDLKSGDDIYKRSREYDYFFIDMEVNSYVDKLDKDDIGIYVVNDNKKEYVCLFKELD